MIHLPNSLRAKSGNYRFSIPGNPSMYLANSSYGCWIETGCPAEIDFNVSPILLEGNQKIFNLAVSIRDFSCLNEFEKDRVEAHQYNKPQQKAGANTSIILGHFQKRLTENLG